MQLQYDPIAEDFAFHHDVDRQVTGNLSGPPHYHNFFEIYYIESGSCSYFIDHKRYQLQPGDVVLIPEGVIHNTFYQDIRYSRMLINCSRQFIPNALLPQLPGMRCLYRNPQIQPQLYALFKSIEAEYRRNDALSQESLRCLTHMLFFTMARHPSIDVQSKKSSGYTGQVIRYLQQSFSGPLTLPNVAARFFISPAQLSRMLKKETGYGFSEYLNLLRLQHAQTLLQGSGTLSVSSVAAQCGFQDSNYFSLRFKKQYGLSPKQYQQSLWKQQK